MIKIKKKPINNIIITHIEMMKHYLSAGGGSQRIKHRHMTGADAALDEVDVDVCHLAHQPVLLA